MLKSSCSLCNHTECLHLGMTQKNLYRSARFTLLPSSGKCLLYIQMSGSWRTFCFMSSKTENVCVKPLKSCLLIEGTSHQGSWQWNINWGAFCGVVLIYTLLKPGSGSGQHFWWIPCTRGESPFTSANPKASFYQLNSACCLSIIQSKGTHLSTPDPPEVFLRWFTFCLS